MEGAIETSTVSALEFSREEEEREFKRVRESALLPACQPICLPTYTTTAVLYKIKKG